jgi:hypothetical protein
MSKFAKILGIALIFLIAIFGFTSCAEDDDGENGGSGNNNDDPPEVLIVSNTIHPFLDMEYILDLGTVPYGAGITAATGVQSWPAANTDTITIRNPNNGQRIVIDGHGFNTETGTFLLNDYNAIIRPYFTVSNSQINVAVDRNGTNSLIRLSPLHPIRKLLTGGNQPVFATDRPWGPFNPDNDYHVSQFVNSSVSFADYGHIAHNFIHAGQHENIFVVTYTDSEGVNGLSMLPRIRADINSPNVLVRLNVERVRPNPLGVLNPPARVTTVDNTTQHATRLSVFTPFWSINPAPTNADDVNWGARSRIDGFRYIIEFAIFTQDFYHNDNNAEFLRLISNNIDQTGRGTYRGNFEEGGNDYVFIPLVMAADGAFPLTQTGSIRLIIGTEPGGGFTQVRYAVSDPTFDFFSDTSGNNHRLTFSGLPTNENFVIAFRIRESQNYLPGNIIIIEESTRNNTP